MKYFVTDTAPPRVAGRRVKAGDTIELTDTAARYEAQAGHIRLASSEAETAVETPSKASKTKG
ncbi:hypothetical protein [Pleomorphomonas carboxyditropha]|uniref:Uncharacterized protein n=1 Tax=Pleomorphomonas carboxyditropha TaxID=2023338 RepID=A0A2G9WWA0_9HYPH|nr:hypothetical protein [Pleomorphomonas carboxyditropha]PIO98582.1 hypothetical protein CJ014_14790 [Pleomorphomonas carboxyditropha]